ncbi:MAG TPA: LLM class flavin-dependent oxidoreductase [Thermomicrobiales bacterium]|nr:LLM class flavin-dependent oxidoreductase [Thermomicrobiales bacterium]
MNYGHPLEFGTFITPDNTDPANTVALAKRSETLGYDLVTFQDHPYVATYLDTWTLLSWVAGETDRIRLAPNVISLPLRPPSVLARSAASLDLLSGGRFALGLGAGTYREAVVAMGGPKRAPGESVEALDEAIDIIHAMWDVGGRQSVRLRGEHYAVNGAQPGPLPAHDIPIWLGAYKPRMLKLLGEKADGWVITLGDKYISCEGFRDGNTRIDAAATAAGRDPREIRRLLNISGTFARERESFLHGPAESWVEDLLPLVVEDGAGTIILMSDDEETLERFAHDVAPALKEAAEAAIPGGFSRTPIRRASALAKRRAGIAYDDIPASLANVAIEPGDNAYARVKSTYMRGGSPGLVLRVHNTQQVVEALAFSRANPDVPFGIRSGGHGISGRSTNDGGIIIDLGQMNRMEVVDEQNRLVRLGPGARWGDVATFLDPHGWALTSGDYGGVGIGGLATAGGVGFLARQQGLTIDHLRSVDMVLADGSVVRASDDENPDLFWAVRGAGANFGIVTSFLFEVGEIGNVALAQFLYDATDTAGFLQRWGDAMEAAPRIVSGEIIMGGPRPGQPMVAQALLIVASDDPDTVIAALQPFASIAPMYNQNIALMPYASVMANAPDTGYHQGRGEPISHSGLLNHVTPEFAANAAALLHSGATYFFQIRAVGGAVSDVPSDATAWAHRSANHVVSAIGASRRRLDPLWDELRSSFQGLYLSFETDRGIDRLHDAFPRQTLQRLRQVKATYDPDNVFRDNFNITPLANIR